MNFSRKISAFFMAVLASTMLASAARDDGGFWLFDMLSVSPYLSVAGTYSDNPERVAQEKKDIMSQEGTFTKSAGYSVTAGLNLSLPRGTWRIAGNVNYSFYGYTKKLVDDEGVWSESLGISGKTDGGLGWRLSESASILGSEKNYDGDAPYDYSNDDRTCYAFSAGLSKTVTDKLSLNITGTYSITDYDSESLYDSSSFNVSFGSGYGLDLIKTDKSAVTFTVSYGQSESDSADDSHPYSVGARLGLMSRATEKVSYDAGIGASYNTSFEDADGNRPHNWALNYSVGTQWKASDKWNFALHGASSYTPADDVSRDMIDGKSFTLTASYRPLARWNAGASLSYIRESYEDNIAKQIINHNSLHYYATRRPGEGQSRDDDNVGLSVRISYALCQYASLFASWHHTEVFSSMDEFDFSCNNYAVGVSMRY